jgi:hypothetical protein
MSRAAVPRPHRLGALAPALLLGVVLAGCGGHPLPLATAGDAARAGVRLADLEQGRSLVVAKCGGCHRTPLPTEHRSDEWPHMIDEMAKRSNVDGSQRELMARYLVTMASR